MSVLGRRSAGRSAMISFNNNITYHTWQIWALIVEICNCHLGCVLRVSGVSREVTSDMTVNANWLFTVLIIQKWKEIPTFSWRMQNGSQIHPINIYPMMHLVGRCANRCANCKSWPQDVSMGGRSASRSANCHSWPQDVSSNVKLPFLTTRCQYWG